MSVLCSFAFVFLLFYNKANAQYSTSIAYEWKTPEDCAPNEIYNSATFKCQPCDENLLANGRRDKCLCRAPLKTVLSERHQIQCVPCSEGQALSPIDEFGVCAECLDVSGNRISPNPQGQCPACPKDAITTFSTKSQNNTVEGVQTCSACPENTEPNPEQNECVPCRSRDCMCAKNSTACNELNPPPISPIIETESTQNFLSAFIEQTALPDQLGCHRSNPEACQALANLCVLQNYNRDQNTACTLLENLRNNQNSDIIPSIVYANTEASVELFRESAIDATFNVDANAENSDLDLFLAVYHSNGSFLGMHSVREGLLQVCPTKWESIRGAFRFGRLYDQTCRLTIAEVILRLEELQRQFIDSAEMLFCEIYIRYANRHGQKMMYNVPVLNENIKLRGELVNRQSSDSRWLLTRRFFLFDRQADQQFRGELIRVPTHMSFHVQLQLTRDGRIFPPYFQIRHNTYYNELGQGPNVLNADEQTSTFRFKIIYGIDSFRHDKTIEVLMATFCSCCVLFGALKAYSWSRRAGKLMVDAATIITFVLNVADSIGNIFLLVMGCTAVWITFAYKLQQYMVYVPLTYEQEWSFMAYIIAATSLKGVGLLHTYLTLIFTETFFVDWERPRSGIDRSRETTMLDIDLASQKPKRTVPIVIWRTYLIANEWNELQHYRKTSISFQLVSLLLVLEWFHFSDYAIIQPGFARGTNPDEYAETRMSRFAVDIVAYLTIALAQWVITVIVVEKIADPFRNFMDLCSVANISVLAFTHPLRAYYLHGRSVHGQADTDMLEMNMFLQREKENLCGLRGLENGSELQTFIVCLPRTFREKLDNLMSAMRNAGHAANTRGTNDRVTAKVETTAKIHAEITQFVKDFIDHADPTCDYIITEARLIEDVLDIELMDTTRVGCFIRDHSEMAYSSVFVYGNEWAHLSFELLLFAILDMATHSRILAAAVVYVVSISIRSLSKMFFTNNLVKSSLVDHRFLI